MKENTNTQASQLPVRATDQRIAAAKRIDEIASGAIELFKEAGSFESELQVATAMNDLRVALTDDMMQPVMAMMNTDLGFRTDRDPKLTPKDGDGNPMTPYAVEVVKECFIESKLRGFHACGNEWNIIAGRFYACKNGLKRKCEKWPGVTDLKVDFGVPKRIGEDGALVPVTARWIKEGHHDSIQAEIPVRVNKRMGVDAILGKAERKIYKRIHDRLSGITTEDGEVADNEQTAAPGATAPTPRFDTMKQATAAPVNEPTPAELLAEEKAKQEVPQTPPTPPAQPQTQPKGKSKTLVTEQLTPQEHLEETLKAEGLTFADLVAWANKHKVPEVCNSTRFSEIPEAVAAKYLLAKTSLVKSVAAMKGGAK
jgi:hypothetical protein